MDRRIMEHYQRQAQYALAETEVYEELARQAFAGRSAPVLRWSGVGDHNFTEMHLRALERHRDDLHQVKLDMETKKQIESDLAMADELVARDRISQWEYMQLAEEAGKAWQDNKHELNRDKRAASKSARKVMKYEQMANERPDVDRYLQHSDRYVKVWDETNFYQNWLQQHDMMPRSSS
jgi:hypothetical protein